MLFSFLLDMSLHPLYMGFYKSKNPDFCTDPDLAPADFLVFLFGLSANLHLEIAGRFSVNGWRIVVKYRKRAFILVDGMEAFVADGQLILGDGVGLARLVLEAPASQVTIKAFDALFHITLISKIQLCTSDTGLNNPCSNPAPSSRLRRSGSLYNSRRNIFRSRGG